MDDACVSMPLLAGALLCGALAGVGFYATVLGLDKLRRWIQEKRTNINIPDWAMEHFWEEPPEGSWEFWSFRFKPPCQVGDELVFRHNRIPIATAIVAKIEPPGQSSCDRTGKFKRGWKVFWRPESFKDLRINENN